MKAETKEDLQSDMTVSRALYNQYTFWRKVSAIVSVSSKTAGI